MADLAYGHVFGEENFALLTRIQDMRAKREVRHGQDWVQVGDCKAQGAPVICRAHPGSARKKGVGAPCQDTQVMPGEWVGIKGQTRLGRGLSGTCP